MKKCIIIVMFNICFTLLAMEKSNNDVIMDTPTPRSLQYILKINGFGGLEDRVKVSRIIGNRKEMRKTSIIGYIQCALREYNNLYSPEQLITKANKIMDVIQSVSKVHTDQIKPSRLFTVSKL